MSQKNSKVIALKTDQNDSEKSFQRTRGKRSRPIFTACGEVFEKHFKQALNHFFDQIDDELFELSDKAESSTLQTIYFDAMRTVRKERDSMQNRYLTDVSRQCDDFWQDSKAPLEKDRSKSIDEGDFSLVENEALEEQLAVSTMIEKGNKLFDRHIHALNMRFAHLSGTKKIANDENPVAPGPLCHAFELILKQLDLELKIKLVIYKLFDQVVMNQLGIIYDAINAVLIEHHVLPTLTGTIRRTPANALRRRSPSSAGMREQNPESYVEAFHMMQSLLNGYRSHLGIPSSPDSVNGPYYQSDEVLSALSLLQTHKSPEPAAENDVVTLGLKRYVANELKKLQPDGQERPIAKVDEDVIDMVSMVFDFILDDKNLPNLVKALLGRLQIPVVKAAILEKSFFCKSSHPARQLLNKLAQVGLTLNEDHCEGTPAFEKIESIVRRILAEFEHNVGLFSELLEEFSTFMEKEEQRSHTLEERTIQATASKEQRDLGKKTVAREIAGRIQGTEIPVVIRDFFEGPWSDVLFLAFLRKDKEAGAWEEALSVMDQLLQSITPPANDKAKHRILKDVPKMLKNIRKWLETISYDLHKMDQFFNHLETCHVAMLTSHGLAAASSASGKGPLASVRIDSNQIRDPVLAAEIETVAARLAQADDLIESDDVESDGSVVSVAEEIVLQSTDCSNPSTESDDELLAHVKLLEVGQWLELTDENNKKIRAKLSWKSPITSLYVFVNRKGTKVAEKTPQGLAAELRRGSAVLLEGGQVPLIDRAFTAMMNALENPQKRAQNEARAYLTQTLATPEQQK
jgi:Protein of unknown function (DUF1631)